MCILMFFSAQTCVCSNPAPQRNIQQDSTPTGLSQRSDYSKCLHFSDKYSMGHLVLLPANSENKETVAFIEARGTVKVPAQSRFLLEVSFNGARHLNDLSDINTPGIVSLDLRHLDNLDDDALKPLSNLVNLRTIALDETDITDRCLGYLGQLPELTALYINSTLVTGSGFEKLKCGSLKTFSMGCIKLNNECLKQLRRHSKLHQLRMYNTWLTDAGLSYVADVKNLDDLDISRNKMITGNGCKSLIRAKKLARLNISDTSISGKDTGTLCRLTSLTSLLISPLQLSLADRKAIHKALPNCRIREIGGTINPKFEEGLFSPLH